MQNGGLPAKFAPPAELAAFTPGVRMKIWLRWLAAGLLLWVAAHIGYTTYDGLHDDGRRAGVAVVLGNKVNEDGSLSERLRQRLACALRLYRQGRVRRLLVSGGLGREGYYEGDKMRDYLRQHGVPDSLIIVDNQGDNTQATVENTWRLREQLGFDSVLVVSQFYHLTRTKMLFRKRGLTQVSSVAPRYFEWRDIYSLGREFVAYYAE
jgi:vancomycin permeability regulator SanA